MYNYTCYYVSNFLILEVMIGVPGPGGMEGLKSQLKQGNADAPAGGTNGVTDASDQPNEVDEDEKGNIY